MVISYLFGGLGNQLFQYAVGRNLAIRHSTQLKLDVSSFQTYLLRRYKLGHFSINAEIVENESKNRFAYKEKSMRYNPEVLELPPNVILRGFWQTEKYFESIKDIIKEEFSLKDKMSDYSNLIARQIMEHNSICLHIRRGDYVLNPVTHKIHGICSLDYYMKGINLIINSILNQNTRFFIFSDDILWCRKNLRIEYPVTYVEGNGEDRDYEDLILMSKCKHYVIANSSFSWWGAWLSEYKHKIVVAPKIWFRDPRLDSTDLVPQNWIKL